MSVRGRRKSGETGDACGESSYWWSTLNINCVFMHFSYGIMASLVRLKEILDPVTRDVKGIVFYDGHEFAGNGA